MRFSYLLCAILVGSAIPVAHADAPTNWILVQTTVPASGSAHVAVEVTLLTPGGILVGSKLRIGGAGTDLLLLSPEGGIHARATAGSASQDVTLVRDPGSEISGGSGVTFVGAAPGAVVDYVVYYPDEALEAFSVDVTDGGVRVPFSTTSGTGATALRVWAGEGAAVDVDALGLASASLERGVVQRTPETGIVGSTGFDCEAACQFAWSAPDGASGSSTSAGSQVDGQMGFAGPAGAWSWSFSGAQHQPIFAAYAPIGDAWSLFSP